jgi:hypothetical protein
MRTAKNMEVYMLPLTRQDVRRLKTCDRLHVSYLEGRHKVCVILDDHKDARGRLHKGWAVEIVVDGRFSNYEELHKDKTPYSCSAHLPNYHTLPEDTTATILRLPKEGDEILLEWMASDGNEYLYRARTHTNSATNARPFYDRLYFIIKRNGRRMKFFMADGICPNNSARMVKFERP